MLGKFPSFSIIFETENLATVDLANIYRSLDSLAAQTIPASQANEFLIIESGDTPPRVLDELRSKYPWIQVRQAEPGIGYYEAKMLGTRVSTGEIIVFCDSDCYYDPQWLKNILQFYADRPDALIVAGETSTPIRNAYDFAYAFDFIFPRFSKKPGPYPGNGYFANNISFRRNFLLKNPIPTEPPLFRGNCQVHAYVLQNLKGHTIWKLPTAKALHEPPGIPFIFWRFLMLGQGAVLRKKFFSTLPAKTRPSSQAFFSTIAYKLKFGKITSILKEDPRRLWMGFLSLPLIFLFRALFHIGQVITWFKPNFLLERYNAYEQSKKAL
jgi:glycosyltransferase involved in cell wall biosynthesis